MSITPSALSALATDLRRRYSRAETVAHLTGHEIDWGNRAAHYAAQLAFALGELSPERVTIGNARRAAADKLRQAAS